MQQELLSHLAQGNLVEHGEHMVFGQHHHGYFLVQADAVVPVCVGGFLGGGAHYGHVR